MQKTLKCAVIQSFAFMIVLFALNFLLRWLFILFFSEAVAGVSAGEFMRFFYNAFRYEGQIIGVLSALFFFLSFIPKERVVRHRNSLRS